MSFFSRKRASQPPVYRAWADEPVLKGRSSVSGADGYDTAVVLLTLALLSMGALMVYSASMSLADSPRYNTTQYHFLLRHLASITVGMVAAYGVCRIPMRVWYKLAPWLMGAAVLLLFLVLLPGIGETLASRIIEYRETVGPFRQTEDLLKVKGIGRACLSDIRDYIMIGE